MAVTAAILAGCGDGGSGSKSATATGPAAIKATKDFKTDILCKPWYYGEGALHIPNNTDRTVTPKGGKMVLQQDCFDISADDPDIAKVRAIEKQEGIS